MNPSNTRHYVIVWAVLCSIITYIDRVCIAQAKPFIQRDLNLTDLEMGVVISAFVWAYALFEIPTGWMGDRFGVRSTLTRVVIWWSFFTAATAAAWNFASMVVIRFLFGIGEAGCFPNITKAFTTWLPERERVRAQGINWMSARWGGAATPLLVAWTLDFVDWRQAFVLFGVLGFVWAIGFYFWYRDNPAEHKSVNAAEVALIREGAAHDDGHPAVPWSQALATPALWLLWLQYLCISYSWYFYITWLPSWLQQNRGLDFKKSAALAGMPLFFGGIGCLVGGIILAKLVKSMASPTRARSVMGRLGAVIAGLCLASVPNIDGAVPALLMVSLASFGNDLTMPAAWAAAMNLGGRYAGTVSGSMNMMGNAGGALFPIAFPLIRDYLGIDFVFYVSASAYIISFLAWQFLDSSKPIAE